MASKLLSAVAMMCVSGLWVSAQQASSPAASMPSPPKPNVAMTGVWDYNDALSVDAATGRPEQAPQSATQRPRRSSPIPVGNSSGSAGTPAGGPSNGLGNSVGRPVDEFERGAMLMYIAERRALVRDLLEVPELLRINVTGEGVTFIDDLQRERTYPTNGRMQKYQIGAARFEARAYWDATQFRKDIEGANNFKMSELYLVSDDGRRLYVVIRVGDQKKPESIVGVNRVYDRLIGK